MPMNKLDSALDMLFRALNASPRTAAHAAVPHDGAQRLIDGAGHNAILLVAPDHFEAIRDFLPER